MRAAIIFLVLSAVMAATNARAQQVEYCFDRTTYPPRVIVVPAGTMCPTGYIKE